jgi:hypothetical protein
MTQAATDYKDNNLVKACLLQFRMAGLASTNEEGREWELYG